MGWKNKRVYSTGIKRKLPCIKYRNRIISISLFVYQCRIELDSDIDIRYPPLIITTSVYFLPVSCSSRHNFRRFSLMFLLSRQIPSLLRPVFFNSHTSSVAFLHFNFIASQFSVTFSLSRQLMSVFCLVPSHHHFRLFSVFTFVFFF